MSGDGIACDESWTAGAGVAGAGSRAMADDPPTEGEVAVDCSGSAAGTIGPAGGKVSVAGVCETGADGIFPTGGKGEGSGFGSGPGSGSG